MRARRSLVAVVALCSLLTSVWRLSDATAAEGARKPAKPYANMTLGADHIDWQPTADYERVILTVASPNNFWLRREFEAGQPASLSLFDENGNRLPDGTYLYELRLLQRDSEQPVLQAGSVTVRNGSFASPSKAAKEPAIKIGTEAAEVIADDLVVQGDACIGDLCASGDATGSPVVLRLKDSTGLGVRFGSKWQLEANTDIAGPEGFFLSDLGYISVPFFVFGESPDYSLVVSTGGNIGIGTIIPSVRLEVRTVDGGKATEKLHNASPTGYSGTDYVDSSGSVDLFFGIDNAASTTRLDSMNNNPILILTNSTERMRVTSDGKLGIGSSSPTDKVHVFENVNANTLSTVENANSGATAAAFLRTRSDVGTTQLSTHSSGRTITRFGQTLASRGEILHTGGNGLIIGTLEADDLILGTNNANRVQINGSSGAVTIAGNLTVNGTFSNPSSRELKESFEPIDSKMVLDKLARLPIQEWSYKRDDRKLRHVGPTVEDFQGAFGLGTEGQHIFPMDVQGITITAVQGLYQVVQEKDAEIAALRERLVKLEELVSKLAAQQ